MTIFRTGWHLIYTRPHQERKVSDQLQDKQIRTYLPVKKEQRKWSDRVKTIIAPIFPSYLFVYLSNSQEFYEGMRADGACYYVRSGTSPARMSDDEIHSIRMMESNGVNMEVTNDPVQPGQQLLIRNGPLNGLSCEVIQYKGKKRILVRVDILKRTLLADLPSSVFM